MSAWSCYSELFILSAEVEAVEALVEGLVVSEKSENFSKVNVVEFNVYRLE